MDSLAVIHTFFLPKPGSIEKAGRINNPTPLDAPRRIPCEPRASANHDTTAYTAHCRIAAPAPMSYLTRFTTAHR